LADGRQLFLYPITEELPVRPSRLAGFLLMQGGDPQATPAWINDLVGVLRNRRWFRFSSVRREARRAKKPGALVDAQPRIPIEVAARVPFPTELRLCLFGPFLCLRRDGAISVSA
jgi:hypothetical protein